MTLAFIFVNCNVDEGSRAEHSVKQVRGVVESHSTSGAYDMILKVKAETESELKEIIRNVRKVTGVGAAITSIVYGSDNNQQQE
ncbi:MAG TPA: Lrp/AsnC ligand binding domain-containing protein [Nitrososphaera sp.]|nr:Lrp/AsnC ligand binding domain-containing protein [Nitrososphaera sp.]